MLESICVVQRFLRQATISDHKKLKWRSEKCSYLGLWQKTQNKKEIYFTQDSRIENAHNCHDTYINTILLISTCMHCFQISTKYRRDFFKGWNSRLSGSVKEVHFSFTIIQVYINSNIFPSGDQWKVFKHSHKFGGNLRLITVRVLTSFLFLTNSRGVPGVLGVSTRRAWKEEML